MSAMSGWTTGNTLNLPLGRLALCLDCETCFEVGADACPACGSRMWASVARILDRRHDHE
jgi:hypothetical protein